MVKCPDCGKEIKDDKNFCGFCGAKLKSRVCPECNAELDDDNVFCPDCGKEIEDDDTADKKDEKSEKTEESSQKEVEDKETQKEENKTESEEKTSKDKETKKEENKSKENVKYCPHCNSEVYDDDGVFCPECGKKVEIDENSVSGVVSLINYKKLIGLSLIGILSAFLISIALCYLIGLMKLDLYYPLAFFIALLLVIGFLASYFRNTINSGLLGIIIGLVIGLLSTMIVEMSAGFAFSYEMLSGFGAVIFTIFGGIIGLITPAILKKTRFKN